MPRQQHMMTSLIGAPGTALYTSHYEAAAEPEAINLDMTPMPHNCPFAGHVHQCEWLPWPRPEHHCLLVTSPASLLVIVNRHFGGICVGRGANNNLLMYRPDMAP